MSVVKWIVGIVIALVVIGLAGTAALVGGVFSVGKEIVQTSGDAAKVSIAAGKIAEFTLPAGYREEYTVEKLGFTVAAYRGSGEHSHLVLAQSAVDWNIDLNDSLEKAAPGGYNQTTRMTVIETRPVTVRGEETTVVISEGKNSDGMAYRQLSMAFQGKGGPALLTIDEPASRWDADKIDEFIDSIR